jgi:anaerobic selenocysteine-containing dehydrogenase
MFNAVGLSALPEFYTESEQLVPLPHLEYLDADTDEGVPTPFWPGANARRARIVGATEAASPFDLILLTGRPPASHFHSWTHWFWQAQEQWPDLYVQIHPEAAAARGIADGERVAVETGRGRIEALAWLTPGIRRDTVFVPIGWGERQPFHPWNSVNWLTDRSQRDPASEQTNLKTTLCAVRRA